MDEVSFKDGVESALDSLLNERLVVLAGAGLSMAPPSSLPSAAKMAANVKAQYAATYGSARPDLNDNIEDQAEFFFQRDELVNVFFDTLIGPHIFSAPPNLGHMAISDLLLTGALKLGITTNVDVLIECAGQKIFGTVGTGLDGHQIAALTDATSPLLKIHGCCWRDKSNMVFAPGQLERDPVRDRISNSTAWLRVNLLNRDMLIVGFSTDWDYLNSILEDTLGAINPSKVVVVDKSDAETFSHKASELFKLGERATGSFEFVSCSGADFLDELRRHFSISFIRRVIHLGSDDYNHHAGTHPLPNWLEPANEDSKTLWQIRRDLEGCLPNQPALRKAPTGDEALIGLTILQLQAKGAVQDGQYWELHGQKIRILRAHTMLYSVKEKYENELAQPIAPDLVIAVGAEGAPLASNVAREGTRASIIRGGRCQWMTRQSAVEELAL